MGQSVAMPSQPPPGSTARIPRTPTASSAQASPPASRRCAVLVDWCLERVEGEEGKIHVAGTTYTPQMREGASVASRVFRSSAVVRRHDYTTVFFYLIRIARLLNIPKTRENGFSEEVCECFEFGFPILWHRLVNPKMELDSEHAYMHDHH